MLFLDTMKPKTMTKCDETVRSVLLIKHVRWLSFRGDHLISWKVIFDVKLTSHAGNCNASIQSEIVASTV